MNAVQERHLARNEQRLKEYWQELEMLVEAEEITADTANEWYSDAATRLGLSEIPVKTVKQEREEVDQAEYPIIQVYLKDGLAELILAEAQDFVVNDKQLSESRSLALAAAKLAAKIGEEHERLEANTKQLAINGLLTDKQAVFYDKFVEKQEIKGYRDLLVDLTKTRTLASDEYFFRD